MKYLGVKERNSSMYTVVQKKKLCVCVCVCVCIHTKRGGGIVKQLGQNVDNC